MHYNDLLEPSEAPSNVVALPQSKYSATVKLNNTKQNYFNNKTLSRARDPYANGAWLNKRTE